MDSTSVATCLNMTLVLIPPPLSDSIESNEWELLEPSGSGPSARQDHAAVPIGKEEILIWGGKGDTGLLGDAAIFNAEELTWRTVTIKGKVPSARSAFSACRVSETEVWFLGGKVSGASEGPSALSIDLTLRLHSSLRPQSHQDGLRDSNDMG